MWLQKLVALDLRCSLPHLSSSFASFTLRVHTMTMFASRF